ncbi:MAG: hypothetical protein AB1505_16270 [Candidatus Latescibacterota bacterium]
MTQAKFSLTSSQVDFLSQYRVHGFRDKSAMVRAALQRLQDELERQSLAESAEIYREVYEADSELKEWTESASVDWPA